MGDELSYKYDIIIFIKKYYAIIKIKKKERIKMLGYMTYAEAQERLKRSLKF